MLEFCYFYAICCVVSENYIFLSVFKVISVLQSNGKKYFKLLLLLLGVLSSERIKKVDLSWSFDTDTNSKSPISHLRLNEKEI